MEQLKLKRKSGSRYIGVCSVQNKCNDYSEFLESIVDDLDPDDEDPPCPIKCNNRVNPYFGLQICRSCNNHPLYNHQLDEFIDEIKDMAYALSESISMPHLHGDLDMIPLKQFIIALENKKHIKLQSKST